MKYLKIVILNLVFLSLIVFAVYTLTCYYSQPSFSKPYLINNQDSMLNITYIGDSWAFMHQRHNCMIPSIIEKETHQPANIYSYEVNGLTSKIIYRNIFTNDYLMHFLKSSKPKFCFISAGINDCNKKMGINNYKKSMDYIIQFFLYNHIRPIILEIPNYDIDKSYADQSPFQKIIRRISMLVTDTPMDCKQMFRDALDDLIKEKGYQDKVSIVRYNSWNNDYSNDIKQLYLDDGLHLNEQGYAKLDSAIAKEIISLIAHEQ